MLPDLLVASGVAVRIEPSMALPVTDTVSFGATSTTTAVGVLAAEIACPVSSVKLANDSELEILVCLSERVG